jgi:ankyrin repeat protein
MGRAEWFYWAFWGLIVCSGNLGAMQQKPSGGSLVTSVKNGNIQGVVAALRSGEDIQMRTKSGQTLLHVASAFGFTDMVRHVAGLGISSRLRDGFGQTPLHLAARNGHFDAVKRLVEFDDIEIDARDINGQTALLAACARRQYKIAAYLIGNGADCSAMTNEGDNALHLLASLAPQDGLVEDCCTSITMILGNGSGINPSNLLGDTPLQIACAYGNIPIAHYLWLMGGWFRASNHEPLYQACERGDYAMVQFLLDVLYVPVNTVTENGWTPLHSLCGSFAPYDSFCNTLYCLLVHGADTAIPDLLFKQTPLHLACIGFNECRHSACGECIAALVAYGAPLYVRDRFGRTPGDYLSPKRRAELFGWAVQNGDNALMRWLDVLEMDESQPV